MALALQQRNNLFIVQNKGVVSVFTILIGGKNYSNLITGIFKSGIHSKLPGFARFEVY